MATPTTGHSHRCFLPSRPFATRSSRLRPIPARIRLGAAGGIGTPQAVASAFALGASYVLTGTVNEASVESGLATDGKVMLAAADIADIAMAPAADMFELGVELQVLKRGTMFAPRAKQLYQIYRTYPSLEAIPAETAHEIETKVLDMTIAECWATTRAFWMDRDPEQVTKAEADPRHKMALTIQELPRFIEPLGHRWDPGKGDWTTRSGAGQQWEHLTLGRQVRSR